MGRWAASMCCLWVTVGLGAYLAVTHPEFKDSPGSIAIRIGAIFFMTGVCYYGIKIMRR